MTDVDDETKFKKLRRFNLIMGFFHFIQAAIMLAIANYDVQMRFTTSYIDASGGFPPMAPGSAVEFFSVPLGPMVAIFLLMSAIALALAAAATPHIVPGPFGLFKILAIAAIAALTEAVSPHGWDNATMQVVPSALAWLWLV